MTLAKEARGNSSGQDELAALRTSAQQAAGVAGDAEVVEVRRRDVLGFRAGRHRLRPASGRSTAMSVALLDQGVQDTGPNGARWALAVRDAMPDLDDLVVAWTLRGAPHAYRRRDLR